MLRITGLAVALTIMLVADTQTDGIFGSRQATVHEPGGRLADPDTTMARREVHHDMAQTVAEMRE